MAKNYKDPFFKVGYKIYEHRGAGNLRNLQPYAVNTTNKTLVGVINRVTPKFVYFKPEGPRVWYGIPKMHKMRIYISPKENNKYDAWSWMNYSLEKRNKPVLVLTDE